MSKIGVVIVILLVVVGGILGFKMLKSKTSTISQTPPRQTLSQPGASTSNPSGKVDSSDSALDQDFSAVQNNLNKLDKDQIGAGTDSSAQDTPPAQ